MSLYLVFLDNLKWGIYSNVELIMKNLEGSIILKASVEKSISEKLKSLVFYSVLN